DGLDVVAQFLLAEREHLLRRVGDLEQFAGGLVDAGIGGLRRQHHRNEERVGGEMLELPARLWIGLAEALETFANLHRRPWLWRLGLGGLGFGGQSPGDTRYLCLVGRLLRPRSNGGRFRALGSDDFRHEADIVTGDDCRQWL